MRLLHNGMAVFLWGSLVLASAPSGLAIPTTTSASEALPEAVQQSPEQLRQLVAPIALYPDALVGQIMAAATYPSEVMEAEQWMGQQQGLTGDALAKEVDKQSWDPSVKALTEFPAVLGNMSQNLAWTSELGDAYVNQRQSLTQAIQTMRLRAKDAGNLKSTSEENVTTEQDTIDIQPVSTEEVYVPQYDPWLVYGDPLPVFPGWAPWPGLYLDGPGIGFGLGFGIGLFTGFGWGWNHWGCDWHNGAAVYNHQSFVPHGRDIVNRNDVTRDNVTRNMVDRDSANRDGGSRHAVNRNSASHSNGRRFAGHAASHSAGSLHAAAASHFSAHAYFHSGGFHGGGFHGGGFHGGGFHGGGHGGRR